MRSNIQELIKFNHNPDRQTSSQEESNISFKLFNKIDFLILNFHKDEITILSSTLPTK